MNKKRSLKENIVQKRVFLTSLKETHKKLECDGIGIASNYK